MDEDNAGPPNSPLRVLMTILVIIIIPLATGLFMAPRLVRQPKIGLIHLDYDIEAETVQEIQAQLAYAREDPAVKAVVLMINSPGGSAAYSEELFMDILNTREEMPVVASVDLLAASGAYYAAVAADEIYAKPTSSVGSVGVVAVLPGPVFIDDDLLTTGPYKTFGGTRDGMMRQIELAKFAFLEAVQAGRGERLQISPDQLSRAEIFNGTQAQALGLIDGLAASDEAVQQAAELAGIKNYQVVELLPLAIPETPEEDEDVGAYRPPLVDARRLWAPPQDLPAGLYYRLIVPSS